jgi:hypothetical protein
MLLQGKLQAATAVDMASAVAARSKKSKKASDRDAEGMLDEERPERDPDRNGRGLAADATGQDDDDESAERAVRESLQQGRPLTSNVLAELQVRDKCDVFLQDIAYHADLLQNVISNFVLQCKQDLCRQRWRGCLLTWRRTRARTARASSPR